jgi:protein-L-isoaspartate(D-aspartate) O-methyltransferase
MRMNPADIERARYNMIEQQVRPWQVLDPQVLQTMQDIPREAFVPETCRSLAFADTNIPLGHDQVMMAPVVEGRLLQALTIHPQESVLEIGTGSGFLTACLARLGQKVTSIDIFPDLVDAAAARLAAQQVSNIALLKGDAFTELDAEQRYDVIAVTGSIPLLTQEFHRNLKTGGRLFVITGKLPIMEALLITRISDNHWSRESLFETCIPPLLNAPEHREFIL